MAKSRVKVTFNRSALKKAVLKSADDKFAEISRKINALSPEYTGRPVPEVKEAISRVWAREMNGHRLPEEHLTAYAEQIAAGGRVTIKVRK